jgi:hypothetical protein
MYFHTMQVLTPLRAPKKGGGLGAATLNPLLQPVMNRSHPANSAASQNLQESRMSFSVKDRVTQVLVILVVADRVA